MSMLENRKSLFFAFVAAVILGWTTGCDEAGFGTLPEPGQMPPDAEAELPERFRETRSGRRYMAIIGLNSDKVEEYRKLHEDIPPSVQQALNDSEIHNYSVFIKSLDGQYYAVRYFEHSGSNLEVDMAKLEANPAFQKWRNAYELCQIPIPKAEIGVQWWSPMEEIGHVD